MEHKYTVQTQITLLHLIRVCTICYSAVLNKNKRKYSGDSILNIGPKYTSIHCVFRSCLLKFLLISEHILCIKIILLHLIRIYLRFYSTFSNNLAISLIQQLHGVQIVSVTMVCQSFKGRESPLHDKHLRKI